MFFNYKARNLNGDCQRMIAVGGISYGDGLGAGEGWAKNILFNANLADQLARFLALITA